MLYELFGEPLSRCMGASSVTNDTLNRLGKLCLLYAHSMQKGMSCPPPFFVQIDKQHFHF